MKTTRLAAAVRESALLRFVLLFCASFAAALFWTRFGAGPNEQATSVAQFLGAAATAVPVQESRSATIPPVNLPQDASRPDGDSGLLLPSPLPAAHFATLVEAGISADDSEQRSLAILELAQAPVEQSLGGLIRILRENRDARSRLTALEALLGLPDSPQVREQRQRILELLSRDPDERLATAARRGAIAS